MGRVLLEVIVTDVADAQAAARGGADRVELVGRADLGGMTPDPALAAAVASALDIPVRAMLRVTESHLLTSSDVAALIADAERLLDAGVTELVLGAAAPDGQPDTATLQPVIDTVAGMPFTFHRALDTAPDLVESVRAVLALPGCDTVLTSGHPAGVATGLPRLEALLSAAPDLGATVMVGGGLRVEHLPRLVGAGAGAVHLGRTVRDGGSWSGAVHESEVAGVRRRLDELTTG
ncbi:copper homeostasis protein CutC [Luteipulveratus halotolerans]|uniref:Copper homeostasis protein cutC homolog n=1 Tax=Luteipulveratus halotolerans TaxID=1631356 RepID=A0A0L6CID1_9MICO|nr:copper homeostasis protein CutC [Luteipulveratus halotolerans]KNX37551.1 hypothetical protein VV01_10960 [Luteipulveratus halotolerans]